MFKNFRIKRLQERIVQRGNYNNDIDKSIEELKELIVELERIKLKYHPYCITIENLRKECGNLQKEIEDVCNIMYKLKLLFVRTFEQRKIAMESKQKIIYSLKQYLERGI